MITHDSILVQLIHLIERIPSPPAPPRRRGRSIFYSEKLFLKALVIMTVRRLHKVGELLAVLDEPTPEMMMVRQLLREEGRFPSPTRTSTNTSRQSSSCTVRFPPEG